MKTFACSRIICGLIGLAFGLHGAVARAQWQAPQGLPINTPVTGFATVGDSVFTVTPGNIFLTSDFGASWSQLNFEFGGSSIATFPTFPNIIVGCEGSALNLSTNSGANWNFLSFTGGVVLYSPIALSDSFYLVGSNDGVWRVVCSQGCWSLDFCGLIYNFVGTLVESNGSFYAGVYGGGVFRSTGNFGEWDSLNTGLNDKNVDVLFAIGDTLLCGTDGGTFRTTNAGGAWEPVAGLPTALCFDTVSGVILSGTPAGVYASTDGGATWAATGTTLNDSVVGLGAAGGVLFAGTNEGAFTSSDGGAHWMPVHTTVSGSINALASNGETMFAASNTGLYASTDDGISWFISSTAPWTTDIRSLASGNGIVYAGTGDSGVYNSTDNGAHWQAPSPTSRSLFSSCVSVIDIVNGIVITTSDCNDSGIISSTDNGMNWEHLSQNVLITSFTAQGSYWFAGNGLQPGVLRSSDEGVTWSDASVGLPADQYVYRMYAANGTLFASGNDFFFRSTDEGATWENAEKGFNYDYSISFTSYGNLVFSSSDYNGVFASSNNGTTWVPISTGYDYFDAGLIAENGKYLFANVMADFDSYGVWRYPLNEVLNGVNRSNGEAVPPGMLLCNNYPNPFSGATTFAYSLPASARVTVSIYNMIGERVASFDEGVQIAGSHNIFFNAEELQNGVYCYRIAAGKYSATGTMSVLK